jgi:hypothetical protein
MRRAWAAERQAEFGLDRLRTADLIAVPAIAETVDVVASAPVFGNATVLRHHFPAGRATTPHACRGRSVSLRAGRQDRPGRQLILTARSCRAALDFLAVSARR